MKIVLTGASGFIGRKLYTYLKKQCVAGEVIGVCRSKQSIGELIVIDSYRDCPSGDMLIHLAENSDLGEVEAMGEEYLIEQRAIAQSLALKFPRVIYLSSTVLYGNAVVGVLAEDAEIKQDSYYQRTKKALEDVFISSSEAVILRLSNLYGGHLKQGTVLSDIAKQLDAGEIQLRVLNAKRDFLHVDDLCQLILKVIQSFKPGIFNVGYGKSHSAEELAQVFTRLCGVSKEVKGERKEANFDIVIENIKICETFGWRPRIDIENGIREILRKASEK